MKIGVLGTGPVGQTVAAKLAELRHGVFVGTRNPEATLARTNPNIFGNPPFKVWGREPPGHRRSARMRKRPRIVSSS